MKATLSTWPSQGQQAAYILSMHKEAQQQQQRQVLPERSA
jgi:hypothetical protein